jgi:hypothetical protein
MLNIVFYSILIFWVGTSYYSFYKSGGIKGTAAAKSEYEAYLLNAAEQA